MNHDFGKHIGFEFQVAIVQHHPSTKRASLTVKRRIDKAHRTLPNPTWEIVKRHRDVIARLDQSRLSFGYINTHPNRLKLANAHQRRCGVDKKPFANIQRIDNAGLRGIKRNGLANRQVFFQALNRAIRHL